MRSRKYRGLLVVSALIGVVVSIASWGFLEITHWLQQALYFHLPKALGSDSAPWWWPLPVLGDPAVGVLIGASVVAVLRLPLSRSCSLY
jgi:hypothetical protein